MSFGSFLLYVYLGSHSVGVSIMEIIKRAFCKDTLKKNHCFKLGWQVFCCLMVYWFELPD